MEWKHVEALAGKTLQTTTERPFVVERVTPTTVYLLVGPRKRRETISRANLEKAAELLRAGKKLGGPSDYRLKVADERPACAWAILHELSLVG